MNPRTIQTVTLATLLSVAAPVVADTYTTIDFPGAISTDLSGINSSGVMVGSYTDSTGASHAFKFDGGAFTAIDYPGAILTAAFSVNPRGDVAGYFQDAANQWHGFVLSDGDYFVQDYPGATTGTFTLGVGANGTLVGEFKTGQTFGQLGFAWILRDGRYVELAPPGSVHAFATSINPRGDVVGRLVDAAGQQLAWKLDKKGTYSIIRVPQASLTNARGISPKGEVVGVYRANGVNHGFVVGEHDLTNFAPIDFPGATSTRALGINACGDIVGTYALAGPLGSGHGFLLKQSDGDCSDDD